MLINLKIIFLHIFFGKLGLRPGLSKKSFVTLKKIYCDDLTEQRPAKFWVGKCLPEGSERFLAKISCKEASSIQYKAHGARASPHAPR